MKPRDPKDLNQDSLDASQASVPRGHGDVRDTKQDIINASVAMGLTEPVSRFGSANAEYIKGFRGFDNENGVKQTLGLADIAKYKVNADPELAKQNIKQQAGYSAEVAATSRDNAEAIISGSKVRTSRSDDLPEFGRNHNVVDRVQILDGQIIEGSQAQMKFVGDRDQLFERIASEDGKFARYRGVKLELPSEQFEGAEAFCRDKATQLREQAAKVEQLGKADVAEKLRNEANNYDALAENVRDSGLTTEEAIFYREHPEIATAMDIARTSHRAGVEGAKFGAAIGGSISLLQNLWATSQGDKTLSEAALDLGVDTAKAGALGYATGFAGSAVKGFMQQSGNQSLRNLAGTSAPAMVINVCLSLGTSIKRFVTGEITEVQLLTEVGEKGSSMLTSGMMAAVGQVVIPIPVVGAAIGGMIGCTLSSMFYQSALEAARDLELSRQQLERTRAIQAAARDRIAVEKAELDAFTAREIPQLRQETAVLFAALDGFGSADEVAGAINHFATLLGQKLQFASRDEFDEFMESDEPLVF